MDKQLLHLLEYSRILGQLAGYATSAWGKEKAMDLSPAVEEYEVLNLLDQTEEALEILSTASSIPLSIRDLRDVLARAHIQALLEEEEIYRTGATLAGFRRLKQFFTDLDAEIKIDALQTFVEELQSFPILEKQIEQTFDDAGKIKDDATPELRRLRREIVTAQGRVKEKLNQYLRSSTYQKYFQDLLVTVRSNRYVLPVKQEYRHHFPGIIHDQSGSGATLFIEPMAIVELNNSIRQSILDEEKEVERILRNLSDQIAKESRKMGQVLSVATELDLIFAKAKLAESMKAIRPQLNHAKKLKLIEARHPLIPSDKVVPISLELGKEFQTLLITGPNTGGKTVTLKTLGLLSIMLQAGLFIPAAPESEMTIFTNIYTDIGDEQSIEHSLSTFSGHMKHLISILSQVKPGELVLIDEIGAGTDPREGAALAMAILEYLHHQQILTIATSHYGELKAFAYSMPGIENASVEFDPETLQPTYRLLTGVPGSSNALYISKHLGLAPVILQKATEYLSQEHTQIEAVLADLHAKKADYEEKVTQAAYQEREARLLKNRLEQEYTQWQDKKQKLREKTQEQEAAILRQARCDAEEVIGQLKAQFANTSQHERQEIINRSRQRLSRNWKPTDQTEDQEGMFDEAKILTPGQSVYVTTVQQMAEIISIQHNEATVLLGQMKMNVPLKALRDQKQAAVLSPLPKSAKKVVSLRQSQSVRDIATEIDLRGLTVAEAEDRLDKFIDEAVLGGLGEAVIIHGKGTGLLRKGLQEYFARHPQVKSSRIGDLSEGGYGVTVIKLC